MSEMKFIDYKNREIRVCGDIFKPFRRVKIRELMKAQNELEKLSKEQEKVQGRVNKIKELMELETDLDKYDELQGKLDEEEAKLDMDSMLTESAKIVLPFFEGLTIEEYLDNAEPHDNYTVAVHLPAIQAFCIGKPEKYINDMYLKVIDANIDNYLDNIINPSSE